MIGSAAIVGTNEGESRYKYEGGFSNHCLPLKLCEAAQILEQHMRNSSKWWLRSFECGWGFNFGRLNSKLNLNSNGLVIWMHWLRWTVEPPGVGVMELPENGEGYSIFSAEGLPWRYMSNSSAIKWVRSSWTSLSPQTGGRLRVAAGRVAGGFDGSRRGMPETHKVYDAWSDDV